MQILGLVLILISVGSIAVPVVGVVIIYSDDLSQLIIPSELEDVPVDVQEVGKISAL